MTITDYAFGTIRIEGKTYSSDVIVTPDTVKPSWWRKQGHRLDIEDLAEVVAARPQLLIVGTGYYGRMSIPQETKDYLESNRIRLLEAPTREAVRDFNKLQETMRTVGAFHLTC